MIIRGKMTSRIYFFVNLFLILFIIDISDGFSLTLLQCSPSIDGIITEGEYPHGDYPVKAARFYGGAGDAFSVFHICWNNSFLYVAGELEDRALFSDGPGTDRWQTWLDDSVELYLHPVVSEQDEEAQFINQASRVIAFTVDGRYWRVDKGTGDSASPTIGVEVPWLTGELFGQNGLIKYNYKAKGTINDGADRDEGWSFELAIPWSILNITPNAGSKIKFNFYLIRDDDGGGIDPSLNSDGIIIDEWTVFGGERFIPSQWDEMTLYDPSSLTVPAISGLMVDPIEGRRAVLHFSQAQPEGDGIAGAAALSPVSRYVIRLYNGVLNEIDEGAWQKMEDFYYELYPNMGADGSKWERIEVIGLTPSTEYTVAIRAMDEAGRLGPIASATFKTPDDDGIFITTSPLGRMLTKTDGTPFTIVPEVALLPWLTVRGLYDGMIYDPVLNRERNFFKEEGDLSARVYLDTLKENHINTLLTAIESLDRHVFFEKVAGEYNEESLKFLDRLIALCKERGIYLIVRLYDTYYYLEKWQDTPWYKLGKVSSDNFFDSDIYDVHKNRIKAVLERYKDEPAILAWEIINEIDNKDRFNSARYDARMQWVMEMSKFAKSIDPHHLISFSFITWDPKDNTDYYQSVLGFDATLAYRLPDIDLAFPHAYYFHLRAPKGSINGPEEMVRGIAYGFHQIRDLRPILDEESGPSPLYLTQYSDAFSAEDDNLFFLRNMWGHFVAGGAGANVRWPGDVLANNTISDKMRGSLRIFAEKVGDITWRGRQLRIMRRAVPNTSSASLTLRIDGRNVAGYVMNPYNESVETLSWPADTGIYSLNITSAATGDITGNVNGIIGNELKLEQAIDTDFVIIGKRSPLRLYTDKETYKIGEDVSFLIDLYPIEKEDVYIWLSYGGDTVYLLTLDLANISYDRTPILRNFSFSGKLQGLKLFSFKPTATGDYKIGIDLGRFSVSTDFKVNP